jgi:transposase
MLMVPPAVRIYVATAPVDMRRSYDGLSLAVEQSGPDPTSGHLFVFLNRKGTQMNILHWDTSEYCIVAKRLAQGTFRLTKCAHEGASHVALDQTELTILLEGIDIRTAICRKRFRLMAQKKQPNCNSITLPIAHQIDIYECKLSSWPERDAELQNVRARPSSSQ